MKYGFKMCSKKGIPWMIGTTPKKLCGRIYSECRYRGVDNKFSVISETSKSELES